MAGQDLEKALLLNPDHYMAMSDAADALSQKADWHGAVRRLIDYMRSPMFRDEPSVYHRMAHCCHILAIDLDRKKELRLREFLSSASAVGKKD